MGDDGEHRMSNYGRQELNAIEMSGQWKEIVNRDAQRHKNHLAINGGSKHWPGVPKVDTDKSVSYYNDRKNHTPSTRGYDIMFHINHGYNSHLHRDDREHTVGLNLHDEELGRPVPVLSSSAYGRRIDRPFEDPAKLNRKFVRIERVMKGFYRTRGTGIPTSMDEITREHPAH